MNDYYEILGVDRDADQAEIKKAYRKKARQLHPDYAGPESEEAFKELSVAYETLSDPEKRRMYDLGGPDALRGGGAQGAGFGFGDFFDAMFGGGFSAGFGSSAPPSRTQRGKDQRVALEITLEEAAFGGVKEITIPSYVLCHACSGSMCEPGTEPATCANCRGSGVVVQVQNTLLGRMQTQAPCPACQGYGTTIPSPCHECSGTGRVRTTRTLSVEIPAGAASDVQLRQTGQGEVGPGGGPAGDLYIVIREKKHPVFDRHGDDLHTWITIPMTTAALGTDFQLDTLDGPTAVTIRPGTQPHEEIVLDGLGVGRLQRPGRGDLHVHIEVEVPTKLDARSRELLEQLAEIRGEEHVQPHHREQGFFERLRETFTGQ
ncbi:molecular chaperone DnaJ [Actinomyces sp. B33]|uniref:molecular chaperone DnaJ n=1 Tax=Actinomyces sp. B33 TaxID=2942131 RepID=UPI00233FC80E|nr:molecular chaperone DnaJ [Actinomyces sp. B33]MDC4232830.1 molecular chaperone DnaJ [Actinomyces sp. B33]